MTRILIVKTAALGDVLRTTSIVPGLRTRYPGCRITWLTAPGAVDLVGGEAPLVEEVLRYPPPAGSPGLPGPVAGQRAFDRVLSFDDERELARIAWRQAGGRAGVEAGVLSGAYEEEDGTLGYTPDTAAWFDMGLLSVHGKERADELKIANRRSHPEIYAEMLGIEMGEPSLSLPAASVAFAAELARGHELAFPVIGFNTGAGGRWESKRLSVEKTAALAHELHARLAGRERILLLGGPEEGERNAAIREAVGTGANLVDAGTGNAMLDFAALVDLLDLLVTSDSLAMHIAIARRVPIVAFFAPTSAAEIELYGRGEKVESRSPDYCTYKPHVDTSTLTVDRLADAVLRSLPEEGRAG